MQSNDANNAFCKTKLSNSLNVSCCGAALIVFFPHIILRLWQSLQTPTWILPSRSEKQQHMLPCVFSWCLPHLANKLNPDLIFLTRSGVHLWEMLTIKPESLPLCSTGMTRIKFCNIWTIWICSLSSYGKENVALGACAFFQIEVKSKTKRLSDLQTLSPRKAVTRVCEKLMFLLF